MKPASDLTNVPAPIAQSSEPVVLSLLLKPARQMLWVANFRDQRAAVLYFCAQIGMIILCAIPYFHWPTVKAAALLVPYTPWAIFGTACPFVLLRFLAKKRQSKLRTEMQDLIAMMRAFYSLSDVTRTDLSWFSKVTWNACPLLSDELDQCQSRSALSDGITLGALIVRFSEENRLTESVEIGKALVQAEKDGSVLQVLESKSVELSNRWLKQLRLRRWIVGCEMTLTTIIFVMPLAFMPVVGPAAMPILRALPVGLDSRYYDSPYSQFYIGTPY